MCADSTGQDSQDVLLLQSNDWRKAGTEVSDDLPHEPIHCILEIFW